jgi:uncharacterized lipoprotein NlpE involved in copper resistance
MNRFRSIIVFVVFLLSACNNAEEKSTAPNTDTVSAMKLMTDTNAITAAIDSTHNAQNSLDWNGTYKGVLPCADCAGIETEITLFKDQTYTIKRKYQGKKGVVFSDRKVPFTWIDGSMIRLDGEIDGPSMYMVGENKITQLDMSGKQIKGSIKEKYVLKKQQTTQE